MREDGEHLKEIECNMVQFVFSIKLIETQEYYSVCCDSYLLFQNLHIVEYKFSLLHVKYFRGGRMDVHWRAASNPHSHSLSPGCAKARCELLRR